MKKPIPTASQTVGPFFHVGLRHPELADLTRGGKAKGETIVIEGQVRDGDGAPVCEPLQRDVCGSSQGQQCRAGRFGAFHVALQGTRGKAGFLGESGAAGELGHDFSQTAHEGRLHVHQL